MGHAHRNRCSGHRRLTCYGSCTQEQVQWAVQGGADFIVAETFVDFGEALLALECIQKYGEGRELFPSSPYGVSFIHSVLCRQVPLPTPPPLVCPSYTLCCADRYRCPPLPLWCVLHTHYCADRYRWFPLPLWCVLHTHCAVQTGTAGPHFPSGVSFIHTVLCRQVPLVPTSPLVCPSYTLLCRQVPLVPTSPLVRPSYTVCCADRYRCPPLPLWCVLHTHCAVQTGTAGSPSLPPPPSRPWCVLRGHRRLTCYGHAHRNRCSGPCRAVLTSLWLRPSWTLGRLC